MKRITALLVCFAVACAAFAAGGGEATAGSDSGNLNPPGQLPLVKETVTLRYVLPEGVQGITANPSNDLPVMQEYEKLTNVHIEWEVIPSSGYNEAITARMNAGVNLPDMMQVPGTIAEKMARDGIVLNLTDMVEELAPNLQRHWAQNAIEKVKLLYPDGSLYYLTGYVLPDMLMPGLMVCQPWMEALGLEEPETTDELYEVLKAFRDRDPNNNGLRDEIPLSASNSELNTLASSFGLQLEFGYNFQADANGKVVSDWVTPQYREFLTYLNRLYEEKLLTQDFLSYNTQTSFEHTGKDIAGYRLFWHTWAPRYSGLHPAGTADGNTPVFIPQAPPRGPFGDDYKLKRILSSSGGWAITKDSKNPEAALKWYDYIVFHEDAQRLYIYGIEGITYRMEGGNRVRIEPAPSTGKNWEQVLIDIGGRQPAHPHVQTVEGRKAIFQDWIFPYDEAYQPYYKEPFVAGLMALTDEEKGSWNQYNTDVTTYVNEMRAKFITGQEPFSNYDQYVTTLKRLGLDALVQIRQQQYQRYLDFTK